MNTLPQNNSGKVNAPILIACAVILIGFIAFGWLHFHNKATLTASTALSATTTSAATIDASSTSGTSSTTTTTASGTTSAGAPPSGSQTLQVGHAIGIAAGGGLSKMDSADLNQELDEMVAAGVTWVRFDIEWGDVQYNSPNDSTWGAYDTLVAAIAAHHLHGLGIIVFTPQWARDPSCTGGAKCPPANPQQYATFASEVVARYKGDGIHAWEVWNEPNNYDFWATKTNCDAYTALLKTTYPAIKKVDPTAIVITGGLAPEATDNNNISQMDFLNCIYRDGGKGYFDAVGDHAYTFPTMPSSNDTNVWAQMSETSPSLRSIMVANGDANKKIWITEFGAPTDGPDPAWYVSEAQQAQMVTDALGLYKNYSWAGPLFWYSLKDAGTTTDTSENFFGLIRADNSLKPAYTTLKNLIAAGGL
jgi:hypothetical protein